MAIELIEYVPQALHGFLVRVDENRLEIDRQSISKGAQLLSLLNPNNLTHHTYLNTDSTNTLKAFT